MGTSRRNAGSGPIADQMRDLVREQVNGGWTCARIAQEMRRAGRQAWTESTVSQLMTGHRQVLTVDEAVALLAVLKSRARLLEKEVDRITSALSAPRLNRSYRIIPDTSPGGQDVSAAIAR